MKGRKNKGDQGREGKERAEDHTLWLEPLGDCWEHSLRGRPCTVGVGGRALALDLTYLAQVQALLLDLPSFSSLSSVTKWKTSSQTRDLAPGERLMSSSFH